MARNIVFYKILNIGRVWSVGRSDSGVRPEVSFNPLLSRAPLSLHSTFQSVNKIETCKS